MKLFTTRHVISILFIFFTFSSSVSFSQTRLMPGFDGKEYIQILEAYEGHLDSTQYKRDVPVPSDFHKVYRSPVTGLDNRWELWINNDNSIGLISIRGTTAQSASWLENFYAAMIPAIGTIQLTDSTTFNYKFAADSNCYVHAGWTLGIAYLAPDVIKQIKYYYGKGIKQYIISGHSQGGALSFLLRSYLYYLDPSVLPTDIVYKTYCSAAPKPGNLYYAYDFDFITKGGWGFRVVNAVDWVPEMPFSVQTMRDLNKVNPFRNVKGALKKQPLAVRLYGKHVLNKLERTSNKLSCHYQNFLGHTMGRQVKKIFPQYKSPTFADSYNYCTAGVPIVLMPSEEYKKTFVDDGKNVWLNHFIKPYYTLAEYYFGNPTGK